MNVEKTRKFKNFEHQLAKTFEIFSDFNNARINNQLDKFPKEKLKICEDQESSWTRFIYSSNFTELMSNDLALAEKVFQTSIFIFYYKHMQGQWTDITSIWQHLHHVLNSEQFLTYKIKNMLQQAIIFSNMGRHEEAQGIYHYILAQIEHTQELPLKSLQAEVLFHLSASLVDVGQNDKALAVLEQCMTVASATNEMTIYGYALQQKANTLLQLGKVAEAEQTYLATLGHWNQIVSEPRLAHITYYGLGKLYFYTGRFKESIEVLKKSHRLKIELVEPTESIINCECLLGRAMVRAGLYQDARDYLQKALETSTKIEDTECKINALIGLAEIHYHFENKLENALKYLEEVSSLLNNTPLPYLKIQTLWLAILIQAKLKNWFKIFPLTIKLIQTVRTSKLSYTAITRLSYLLLRKHLQILIT